MTIGPLALVATVPFLHYAGHVLSVLNTRLDYLLNPYLHSFQVRVAYISAATQPLSIPSSLVLRDVGLSTGGPDIPQTIENRAISALRASASVTYSANWLKLSVLTHQNSPFAQLASCTPAGGKSVCLTRVYAEQV
jgi:hypothetical protein